MVPLDDFCNFSSVTEAQYFSVCYNYRMCPPATVCSDQLFVQWLILSSSHNWGGLFPSWYSSNSAISSKLCGPPSYIKRSDTQFHPLFFWSSDLCTSSVRSFFTHHYFQFTSRILLAISKHSQIYQQTQIILFLVRPISYFCSAINSTFYSALLERSWWRVGRRLTRYGLMPPGWWCLYLFRCCSSKILWTREVDV